METTQLLSDLSHSLRRATTVGVEALWVWHVAEDRVFLALAGGREWTLTRGQWEEQVHAADRDFVHDQRNALMSLRIRDYRVVYRQVNEDSVAWVVEEAHVVRDADGGATEIHGGIRVASDFERPHRAGDDQLELYQLLFNSIPRGVVIAKDDGVVVEWNDVAEDLVGLSRETVLNQRLWDVQAAVAPAVVPYEQARRDAREAFERARNEAQRDTLWSRSVETRILNRSAGPRKLQTWVVPLRLKNRVYIAGIMTEAEGTAGRSDRSTLAAELSSAIGGRDSSAVAALEQRVQAVVSIHGLSMGATGERVDLKAYITRLAEFHARACGFDRDRFQVDGEHLVVPSDHALDLGFLLTEFVVEAFRSGTPTEPVSIGLQAVGGKRYAVRIEHRCDGGFPERREGYGQEIARVIAARIGAQVSLSRGERTSVDVFVPLPPDGERQPA